MTFSTPKTQATFLLGAAVIIGVAITELLLTLERGNLQEYLGGAVNRGDIVSAAMLLYAGVSPNRPLRPVHVPTSLQYVRDDGSWFYMDHTDLMYAARDGRTSLVNLLLEWGADPNVIDQGGLTALQHAAYSAPKQQVPTITALLRHGAKVDGLRGSVLVFSKFGEDAAIRILLEQGADINLPGRTGETALMTAAERGRCSTVNLLLARHADSSRRNQQGQDALELAKLSLDRNAFPAPSLQCVVSRLDTPTAAVSSH